MKWLSFKIAIRVRARIIVSVDATAAMAFKRCGGD